MSEFDDFMTPQFERDVLEKITFLKAFGFGEIKSEKVSQEKSSYWWLVAAKGEIAVDVSIGVASTLISMTRGNKYIAFKHYLTFIKSDELTKLHHDYFPNRFDMEASRQYSLDVLDLFAKHARLGLEPVLQGKAWIDVPYYWGNAK